MVASPIRPYQLTGAKYAAWYDVGERLGFSPQSIVSQPLCSGSMKLPDDIDPLTAFNIRRVCAVRGIVLE